MKLSPTPRFLLLVLLLLLHMACLAQEPNQLTFVVKKPDTTHYDTVHYHFTLSTGITVGLGANTQQLWPTLRLSAPLNKRTLWAGVGMMHPRTNFEDPRFAVEAHLRYYIWQRPYGSVIAFKPFVEANYVHQVYTDPIPESMLYQMAGGQLGLQIEWPRLRLEGFAAYQQPIRHGGTAEGFATGFRVSWLFVRERLQKR